MKEHQKKNTDIYIYLLNRQRTDIHTVRIWFTFSRSQIVKQYIVEFDQFHVCNVLSQVYNFGLCIQSALSSIHTHTHTHIWTYFTIKMSETLLLSVRMSIWIWMLTEFIWIGIVILILMRAAHVWVYVENFLNRLIPFHRIYHLFI